MSSGSEKRSGASARRKRGFSDVDSSSSESSDDDVVGAKPRRKCFIIDEDVETDSDGCINMTRKRRVAVSILLVLETTSYLTIYIFSV